MADDNAPLDFEHDHSSTIRKIDPTAMRRLNAIRILDAVRRTGPISRASLAKRTHLSPPAVSALVDSLITRGLLREVGQDVSTGGRRATLVSFVADYGCVVGIDLGSTTVRYALADLGGQVLARRTEPTGNPAPARVMHQICTGIRTLFNGQASRPPLVAIGVGAPGMTDVRRGIVIEAANLRGWKDVALKDVLTREFAVPVAVDNDVNMAALGEYWLGCARGEPNFVFIALGRGVGAGIMIDGRIHRGSQWYAGEISHLLLEHTRWRRDFGSQGYLEHHVGAAAIARARRRQAPAAGARANTPQLAAARQGNQAAAPHVTNVATILGVAVANIVTTLDPALVVVGGGIGQVGEQLLEPLRQVVEHVVPNQPLIRATALGGDAQLFGSVLSALRLANRALSDAILRVDGRRQVVQAGRLPAHTLRSRRQKPTTAGPV